MATPRQRFHLKRPQPAALALLASGVHADLPLPRLAGADAAAPDRHRVRSSSSSTSRTRSIKVAQATRITGSQAGPISTGSNTRSSRTARPRSSPSSPVKFDMTFPYEVTFPLLKDIKAQAPQASCVRKGRRTGRSAS